MLFKEYCILPYYQNCANQGIVINKKSSYCKDRANQGRLNQGLTVDIHLRAFAAAVEGASEN